MKRRSLRSSRSRAGLTLMEVMLVLVILGILGSMAAMFVSGAQKNAMRRTTRAEINVLVNAMEMYRLDMLGYPTGQDGLQALIEKPSSDTTGRWRGPYIKPNNDLKDDWGNEYEYKLDDMGNGNQGPVLTSGGPDRSIGSEDDISSNDQF